MTQKYPNQLLLDRLNNRSTSRIPVWLMRQAGRHLPGYRALRKKQSNFFQFIQQSHFTTAAALEPLERYNLDAAIVFSDILTIPYWLGWPVEFTGHSGIQIPPVKSARDLHQFDMHKLKKNLANWHALADLRQNVTDRPIIGFVGAPWTLACYCLGKSRDQFSEARAHLAQKTPWFMDLLGILTTAILHSIDTQVAQGADTIMIFDSWAGLCNPNTYQSISSLLNTIMAHIANHQIPSILFAKGHSYSEQRRLNSDCITLDWCQNLPTHLDQPIQGLFDPALLLTDFQTIETTVHKTLEKINSEKYIGNLGHGLLPNTPPENVACFVQAIKSAH